MAAPLLTLRDIRLTFGGPPLLDGAELAVHEGDRICLVGRNGSGKSTLLKVAADLLASDGGERVVQGGVTIRYLPQEPDLSAFATTLAYVEAGLGPGDDTHRCLRLLEDLGLTGEENPKTLSGGEIRRAALARVLAPEPDVLLLDEPTNHLDLPAIEWLEAELKSMRSAQVLISHDRRFLQNLSRITVWLDRGRTRRVDRGFGGFEAWRDELLELEEKERHKLERKIAMEMDWLRYGVTARRKRNQRRLGELGALREKRRTDRGAQGTVRMTLTEAEQSGKLVIEAVGVSKAWDRPIVTDFSARIARGDRIGVVGANGTGKSTLLGLLTGQLAPDSGRVSIGAGVEMVTLDQKREALDPERTLRETLTGGSGDAVEVGGEMRHVIGYMKDFLFSADQAGTPVAVLSGGERGRLMLARALARSSNLMVLDEPTNDLDLETLDLLEEMLGDYPGTVIVVSHDRDFLDRVVTSVVMSEPGGRWVEYAGGYSDMVSQRGAGVAARVVEKADAPARIAKAPAEASTEPAKKRRLSFKEKHALETLPARIEALQKDLARHHAALADSGLYARDPARFAAVSKACDETATALATAEDEWLALEMLREELED
ncbi:ATP-binding cassette domain-containing protein [Siculibacillus lacustris]|uniref:ATP-binding cassette domain-containing protein n=1 Tax=Siculibacillus lacustris TaxID=1549641 RepID=A0A4Q9VML7_9HYPH|nr:ATP-binding cassette domain-containing protein [Siculibacillus lacustris]TBW35959.1 ATP-binding cassette domain-containing protein [Siculibacillus lacustris]